MTKTINFIKKHPVLTSALTLAVAAGVYCGITRQAYCTVAEGEVIDEKYVPDKTNDNKATGHYVLFLKVQEEVAGNKEEIYVLRVKDSEEMPMRVLGSVIQPGTKVAFPYVKPHLLTGTPHFIYTPTRFGTVNSKDLQVIHPWENSEAVRGTLEGKIEERKEREHQRFMLEVRSEAIAHQF